MVWDVLSKIIIALLIFSIIIVGILNIFVFKNTKFWELSFQQALTMIIVLGISYYFNDKNSKNKKLKETIERIIEKIQVEINTDVMCNICNDNDIVKVRIIKVNVYNKLDNLKDAGKWLKIINKNIDYILQQFDNYNNIIDNHVSNIPHLKESKQDLSRFIQLINDRLDKVKIDIYK